MRVRKYRLFSLPFGQGNGDLHGLLAWLRQSSFFFGKIARARVNKKDIFMNKQKQGFTLIELLVVVLIIGILAAVALPKYQIAVEKNKATEARTLLKILQNATDLYILEQGYPSEDNIWFTGNNANASLDVNIDNLDCTSNGYCLSKTFAYSATCDSGMCVVLAERITSDGKYGMNSATSYQIYTFRSSSEQEWTQLCSYHLENEVSKKNCSILIESGWLEDGGPL